MNVFNWEKFGLFLSGKFKNSVWIANAWNYSSDMPAINKEASYAEYSFTINVWTGYATADNFTHASWNVSTSTVSIIFIILSEFE